MADDPKKKDEKKDDKKPAKDAKAPEPKAEAASAGKGGLIGIILGVVVLVGAGAGTGLYIVKSLAPAAVPQTLEPAAPGGKPGKPGDPPAQGETADPHATGTQDGLLKNGLELEPIALRANITGSGGTRYVTLSVAIWVPQKDHPKLNVPQVKRLIQSRLEETLRTFQLEDLQSPNIQDRLRKAFGSALEQRIASLITDVPPGHKFILEVTPTELLTQ